MCRFSDTKNGENLLTDIERKNQADGMGNAAIPGTNITLINFSVCPKCGQVFSFKDLREYYLRPRPDPAFKDPADQFRNDTLLKEMEPRPALIANLLQYTPANLVLNLLDGSNVRRGDLLYGAWE